MGSDVLAPQTLRAGFARQVPTDTWPSKALSPRPRLLVPHLRRRAARRDGGRTTSLGGAVNAHVSGAQRAALSALASSLEEGTYLAGGVGVASVLDHRSSRDLDLFVPHDFDPERLEERFSQLALDLRVVGRARGTLHLEVTGVPVSILAYRYPLLEPPQEREGLAVPVASPEDLACMKISAVAGRGAAKDFWDLHELLAFGVCGGSLEALLALYARKFPVEDVGHAVRSLAYFGDADASPLPQGLTPEHWRELKSAFAERVKAIPF